MYKKVSASMDFVPREQEVLKFWKENKIFEKSVAQSEGKPDYTFYDGPPTANGKPHIGHVLTRSMKDIIPRRCSRVICRPAVPPHSHRLRIACAVHGLTCPVHSIYK